MAQITPSKQDVRNLKLIRANVDRLIQDAAELYDKPGMRVLDIAPQPGGGAKAVFKHAEVLTLDIDPDNKPDIVGDICDMKFALANLAVFDAVICTEVIEHVNEPFYAASSLKAIVKHGGTCFVSTPFNFRIHGPLPDNWRFTEHGLRQLFREWKDVQIFPLEDPKRPLCPIHYTLIATT